MKVEPNLFGMGRAEAKASGSRVTRLENVSEFVTWDMLPTHTSPPRLCILNVLMCKIYKMFQFSWVCTCVYVYTEKFLICIGGMCMYIKKLFRDAFDTSVLAVLGVCIYTTFMERTLETRILLFLSFKMRLLIPSADFLRNLV